MWATLEKLANYSEAMHTMEAEIGELLRQLTRRQRETERDYLQMQHTEMAGIVGALAEGIVELARDSGQFSDQLDSSLSKLDDIADLEELRQVRQRVRAVIENSRQLLHEKREREKAAYDALQRKVRGLESQLQQTVEETHIDPLTQIHNRRAFDERIAEVMTHHRRAEDGFGLALFDIDRFKLINDDHGHLIGDRMLRVFANYLKASVRSNDFIARYGGEEFVAIMFASGPGGVWEVAERLREKIENKRFRYQQAGKTEIIRLTVSGGTAFVRQGDSAESILERADSCLYRAKRSGRNRICGPNLPAESAESAGEARH